MTANEMFTTRMDLPPALRERMVGLCNQQLANLTDLYSQTKHAHWNVKGPQFYQLHELFDDLAEVVEGFIDEVAERATQLGGQACGTVRMAARSSRLAEFPLEVVDSQPTVDTLALRYAEAAAMVREAIDQAADNGDAATADLFTEISRGLDKSLWFLEAHLQG